MSEQYQPHGKHLIAGEWVRGTTIFSSDPASGPAFNFSEGTAEHVNRACQASEAAFDSFSRSTRAARAEFLNTIAEEIEVRAEIITAIGSQETGLPEVRLQGERGRTVSQLRLFAQHIERGEYLDRRYDQALPDRQPLARPDLRMMMQPSGPVAVFGASNFPLAFSTAGGDTAAALAAGCPVVVKGHPSHPGTGEIISEAIFAAIQKCGFHPGVFSNIQDGGFETGKALVQHPLIAAVGFTGSLQGGRALFDLCVARPTPIPFFGELGSVNPMFIMPEAAQHRAKDIASGWASSLTMGAGQFCTNPGIAVVLDGTSAETFTTEAKAALSAVGLQMMLNKGIAAAYRKGCERLASAAGVSKLLSSECDARAASPCLLETDAATWLADKSLAEEVFGPLGLIVRCGSVEQMLNVARALEGQLTVTLQLDDSDAELAQSLMPILQRKAGRVLANGFPTGVEVADTMVHGGPYPASTNFGATSVGTLSIRRFLRPVCYQNIPDALLPHDIR